jgi:hypothetical protein
LKLLFGISEHGFLILPFASNAGGRKAHGQRSLPYYAGLISTAEFDPAKFNHDGPASLLGSGARVVSSALLCALDLLGIIDHKNIDMVAIGRVVSTNREHIIALEPLDKV